jgi:acetoin utilization protein AcuB
MMTAEQLISGSIVPLQGSDSGEIALEMMEELRVRHLPIVNGKALLGIVSEAELLDADLSKPISLWYRQSPHRMFARSGDHILEVMRIFSEQALTIVPVLDDEEGYLGCISLDRILPSFSAMAAINEAGGVIVLEMDKRDYSLSEIARIAESERVVILSTFVHYFPQSARMEVTLKVNRQNIQGLVACYQRFNYEVKAFFGESDYGQGLQERYDALMAYLNV